ncbi:uncharacterized protein LOC126896411 [Daktulosphaira vitifoliae]|uniref:uncharacterized protein LOC126896411 n=1 Tax=Daktulosphaira vitifoliae TaxID=58002 RepID=UPI0021A9B899|nr:uncharacterized protein LOC126896411 [Daktulosphaira vitifoliae]
MADESLFSDEELFDSNECVVTLTSSVSYEDEYQSLLFHNRDRIISKLKNDLSNVLPPPPTVTTCRLSVDDILTRWYQYQNSKSPSKKNRTKELKNFDRAKSWQWPQVVNVQCFDVYYNVDNKSAEMALLETKYQERYVSNETKSLMNTGKTPQPKRERGLTRLPAKLPDQKSILRRKPISKPQILAEAKAKLALVENKRRILVPGKLKRDNIVKPLEKSYLENKNSSVKTSGHKRALFQSPETYFHSRKRMCYSQSSDIDSPRPPSALSICSDTSNTTPVKRYSAAPQSTQLFEEECDNKNSKLIRTEPVKKCQRTLNFVNLSESTNKTNISVERLEPKVLSHVHKQKLLWAVSEVLKSCGIDSHHKQFRPFLQQLFKVCSKQWLEQTGIGLKTRTSEAMRDLVMKHKNTVLKLKAVSPKNSSITKDVVTTKQKSVADVRKVLFTDTTPKSDFKFKKFGSELKNDKSSPPAKKNTIHSDELDDITVFFDITKLPNKITNDQQNRPLSSTSDYCSNLDIDSKESESLLAR